MNLLLNAHAWMWFVLGDSQLSDSARNQIAGPVNINFISPASYWEISIKIGLGKYTLDADYDQFMRRAIIGNGFRVLHISPRHTERVMKRGRESLFLTSSLREPRISPCHDNLAQSRADMSIMS
jgi:PIN domain nuclease of toxin-antitoxin system